MEKSGITLAKSIYTAYSVVFLSIVLAAVFPHSVLGNLGTFTLFLSSAFLFGFAMLIGVAAIMWATDPDSIYEDQFVKKNQEFMWDKIVEWQSKPIRGYWFFAFFTLCTASLGWYWYATVFLIASVTYFFAGKSVKKSIGDFNEKLMRKKSDKDIPISQEALKDAARAMAEELKRQGAL